MFPPLANERTFLGYLRTSVALSMLGVIVAQLYRLQHSPTPDPVFGFYAISKPISGMLQCSALGMVLLGAIRFWRQQTAMAVGKVHAGGWEVMTIVVFTILVCCSRDVDGAGVDRLERVTSCTEGADMTLTDLFSPLQLTLTLFVLHLALDITKYDDDWA